MDNNIRVGDYTIELMIICVLAIFILTIKIIFKMILSSGTGSENFILTKKYSLETFHKIHRKILFFSELETSDFKNLEDSKIIEKAGKLNLDISEYVDIRNIAVELNKKSNMPEKFKMNQKFNEEIDQLNKEASDKFYNYIKLNVDFLEIKIEKEEYKRRVEKIIGEIESIFDQFFKIEMSVSILINSIKRNKKGKVNLKNEKIKTIRKKLDEFTSFLEHYTLNIHK